MVFGPNPKNNHDTSNTYSNHSFNCNNSCFSEKETSDATYKSSREEIAFQTNLI